MTRLVEYIIEKQEGNIDNMAHIIHKFIYLKFERRMNY
jgi:hypothetical protein